MKICTKCNIKKDTTEFSKKKQSPDGLDWWCKSCNKVYRKHYYITYKEKRSEIGKESYQRNKESILRKQREKRAANPEARHEKNLKHFYNLTLERFNEILKEQGYKCACCGTTNSGERNWHVDHDHKCCPKNGISCGKCVRGLLCGKCNTGLGQFNDNIEQLLLAIEYLEKWRNNESVYGSGIF
jgi:hypothetical protein